MDDNMTLYQLLYNHCWLLLISVCDVTCWSALWFGLIFDFQVPWRPLVVLILWARTEVSLWRRHLTLMFNCDTHYIPVFISCFNMFSKALTQFSTLIDLVQPFLSLQIPVTHSEHKTYLYLVSLWGFCQVKSCPRVKNLSQHLFEQTASNRCWLREQHLTLWDMMSVIIWLLIGLMIWHEEHHHRS